MPVPRQTRLLAAEPEAEAPVAVAAPEPVFVPEQQEERGFRRRGEDKPEFKHFLPLPKPEHLIFIKPTVAVVAGMASRQSVGLKMTAGNNQLER